MSRNETGEVMSKIKRLLEVIDEKRNKFSDVADNLFIAVSNVTMVMDDITSAMNDINRYVDELQDEYEKAMNELRLEEPRVSIDAKPQQPLTRWIQ